MHQIIRRFCCILCIFILLPMTTIADENHLSADPITKIEPEYCAVENVPSYDETILTPSLLTAESSLPDASNKELPYWTGFTIDARAAYNFVSGVYDGISDGSEYIYEEYFRMASQKGFNCLRVIYSLSFLSDPNDPSRVNLSELKYLDTILSWGFKYNIHVMISILGLPGKADTSASRQTRMQWPNDSLLKENVGTNPELFESKDTMSLSLHT